MVDLGIALTWIAISAAGAKGLSVFARAAATDEIEEEIAAGAHEGPGQEEFYGRYRIDPPLDPLGVCFVSLSTLTDAPSLVRVLGRRHPLAVDERARASGPADVEMARP